MNSTEIIDDQIIVKMYLLFSLKYEYLCIIVLFSGISILKNHV